MTFSTSGWSKQHPNAVRNIQQCLMSKNEREDNQREREKRKIGGEKKRARESCSKHVIETK